MEDSSTYKTNALSLQDFTQLKNEGALVLDARPQPDVRKGFIPGSIAIPLGNFYTKWSDALIPRATKIVLVTNPGQEQEATILLTDDGFTDVKGYLDGGYEAWVKGGNPVQEHNSISAEDFVAKLGEKPRILDVRNQDEWDNGVLEGAQLINFIHLPKRGDEVPKDQPVYIHCKLGGRSTVAYSIMASKGYNNVVDVLGGIDTVVAKGGQLQPPSSI